MSDTRGIGSATIEALRTFATDQAERDVVDRAAARLTILGVPVGAL